MKEMLDNVFLFIGALASLWTLVGIIVIYRRLSSNERRGTTSWGSILMEVLKVLAAPAILWLIVWFWFGVVIPKLEEESPAIAAKSRTGTNVLNYIEDPCSIPGLGDLACGDDPARFGENGELASGEQAEVAGAPIVAAPTGPQPLLIEGEEALRACYQAWYASFQIDGASKIKAGLPPDGKSNVTDWIPSTAGNATLVVQTPAGINNNTGTLSHWLLPAPIQLEQDQLKQWHKDDKGTWSVSGTGSWPEQCYTVPTPAPLPTTAAPVSPPSVSPPEGLTLFDAAGTTLFVPGGTPLTWCSQDPSSGNWYACAPNQQWFWRP